MHCNESRVDSEGDTKSSPRNYSFYQENNENDSDTYTSSASTPIQPPQDQRTIIFIFSLFIYVITGVLQPILIDFLRIRNRIGRPELLLPTFANTAGMALVGLRVPYSQWVDFIWTSLFPLNTMQRLEPQKKQSLNEKQDENMSVRMTHSVLGHGRDFSSVVFRRVIITAIVDLASGMCLTWGLLMTGGSIFVILYNSCPAWTALLSRFLLHKKLSTYQIVGVCFVCIGLISNVWSTSTSNLSSSATTIVVGSIVVLIGSLLHSFMFVLSDLSLRGHGQTSTSVISPFLTKLMGSTSKDDQATTITAEIWSSCLGTLEASFMLLWVVIGTICFGFQPDTETVTGDYDASSDNVTLDVFYGFGLLLLVDAIHAASFFGLLSSIGAVASALLKGVQVVVVVTLSAMLYCQNTISDMTVSDESQQCLTLSKSISVFFVLLGLMCYGLSSSKQKESIVYTKLKTEQDERQV